MATLKVTKREGTGKYVAFNLRKEGKLPAVLYGKGIENQNLAVDRHELEMLIKARHRIFDLEVEGQSVQALIREIAWDTFGNEPLHVDFRRVTPDTVVRADVGIEVRGEPIGAQVGGVLEQNLRTVLVEAVPDKLPPKVVVDVKRLNIGRVWYVRDLPTFEGVKYATHASVPVLSCAKPAGMTAEVMRSAQAEMDALLEKLAAGGGALTAEAVAEAAEAAQEAMAEAEASQEAEAEAAAANAAAAEAAAAEK